MNTKNNFYHPDFNCRFQNCTEPALTRSRTFTADRETTPALKFFTLFIPIIAKFSLFTKFPP
jgi:hypothetical protein